MRLRAGRLLPILAWTAALAALGACGGRAPTLVPGPERAPVALSNAEIDAIASVLRHEDQRRFDATVFSGLLDRGSVEVRRRAALAVGRIGDPAAAPLLLRLLRDDPAPAVRADAAFALGELGDSSAIVVEALGSVVGHDWTPVRAEQTTIVVEVLGALGKLGTEPARGLVAAALRDALAARGPHARRVAAEALLAIWRFGPGPGRLTAIVPYLESADPELRWRAGYALMRLGGPEAAGPLLRLPGDPDHRARAMAARGLSAPRSDSAGIRDTARTALTALLEDSHPHVRINALRSLGGYAGDAPVAAMAALLRDERGDVATTAASALGALGRRARAPLAAAASDPERPLAVRAAAAAQLAALGDDAATASARSWAAGDPASRLEAARLLAVLGWARGSALLPALVRDHDSRVAVAALAAAEAMAADSALTDDARRRLRTLLAEIARAPEPRRRAAALRALGPLVEPGDPDAATLFGVPAPDSAARERAIGAAEREALPTGLAPEATDEPAFYQRIVREYVARPLGGGGRPEVTLATASGDIVVELLAEEAPLTVHNFVRLARAGYFDAGVWHRVVPNFVLQDGAPAGDPSGGPGWAIRDEINRVRYDRGVLGMALSGPDTGGSQWFITHSPQPHLDGGYTVFGRVTAGMDVADRVLQGDEIRSIRIRW